MNGVSYIAIDYGKRRIGIASSDSGILATPHSVIRNDGDEKVVLDKLTALILETGAGEVILGLPRRTRPDPAMEKFYKELAGALRQRTCKSVVLWDESYSTTEANGLRQEAGRSWKKAKDEIDMQAAAVILQSYLDAAIRRPS